MIKRSNFVTFVTKSNKSLGKKLPLRMGIVEADKIISNLNVSMKIYEITYLRTQPKFKH
jgi:hypothetical protein